MFNIGDKVWAKTYKYIMTSYHIPCEIINVDKLHLGKMIVRIAKIGGSYEVDACEFEHIPKGAIFEKGDLVTYSEMLFKFMEYGCMGTAILKHKEGYLFNVEIKDIKRLGGFIV